MIELVKVAQDTIQIYIEITDNLIKSEQTLSEIN